MKTSLFVPEKIKVGFQERDDTYTGKLAYVIYYDEKGKLRKQSSWESWKDDNIPSQEFNNEPIEGFVLNKNVGGYKSGWDFRNSYIRVYDPRGFEFEITVENLLYILNECVCTPGKGLEGKFVYSWDGKNLVLLPTKTPDYAKVLEYNELRRNNKKITEKTIKIGLTYVTTQNLEYLYLGKYDWYEKVIIHDITEKSNKLLQKNVYLFAKINKTTNNGKCIFNLINMTSIKGKFISVLSDEPSEFLDYILDTLQNNEHIFPVDYENVELQAMTYEQFKDSIIKNTCIMFNYKGTLYSVDNFINKQGHIWGNDVDFNLPVTCYSNIYEPKELSFRSYKSKELKLHFTSLKEFYDTMRPKSPLWKLKNGNIYYDALTNKIP